MADDPKTEAEWQHAVNAAALLMQIESAKAYDLVTGGPQVNAERCVDILKRGRLKGIVPSDRKVV